VPSGRVGVGPQSEDLEASWHDGYDFERLAVDLHRSSHDCTVAAEPRRPEAVDDREHGGGGAGAQRKRQDARRRESRGTHQRAEGEPEILTHEAGPPAVGRAMLDARLRAPVSCV
jgi:hypothetical protein